MVCQICGQNRLLQPVTLFQNIGMIRVLRSRFVRCVQCNYQWPVA